MKTFLKVIAWIVGIPLFIVLVFVFFGFLAVRFNVWPPTCDILPIREAKRVCEFSKLNKAPKNKPAEVTFWVTVPYNASADKLLLSIEGKEPIEMEKINNLSFQKLVKLTTGEKLKYKYLRNNDTSFSDEKNLAVKSYKKTVYDYVSEWSDVPAPEGPGENISPLITTEDTWTINYNMNLFEDTRRNLDSMFARIASIGGKEVMVFSFIDFIGDDKESITLKETASPYKQWRDAAIKPSEMKDIARTAKKYGLKPIIAYNVGADYTKYTDVSLMGRFSGGAAGSGSGGNAAEQQAGDDFGRDEPKTKEWLDSEFSQLQEILVQWATDAEKAGIYAINITPEYRMPTPKPFYDYADAKFSEIIKAMREVYHGKIYASNFNGYGGLRLEPRPQYINDADALILHLPLLDVREGASIAEMRAQWSLILDKIEADFADYKKPIYLAENVGSYTGANNGRGGMEWGDFAEVVQAGYSRDWQGQADALEALLQAFAGRTMFAGVGPGAKFAWDDLMAPDYASPRNDLTSNIRNKPAEAVWKKWMLAEQ
ncbi:MAG: hypothetical protein Q7S05_01035 [bacterium]|nr:hypothetical protein [bacterium]